MNLILCLAYSHRDVEQAERLLHWIEFLGFTAGYDLALIPSRTVRSTQRSIAMEEGAKGIFRSVKVVEVEGEEESGWPASPNFMFREALKYAQAQGSPIFWIEPDAIPLTPRWLDAFAAEYGTCGKPFMGARVAVDRVPVHMTGIGFYPANALDLAPALRICKSVAWDTAAAEDIVRQAHFTDRIQHFWKDKTPPTLEKLQKNALIFHQDKAGVLIPLLDQELFGGEFCSEDRTIQPQPMEARFYRSSNATRPLRFGPFKISFEPIDLAGGTMYGVYTTNNEQEISAIDSAIATRQAPGVESITQEEYITEFETKKKRPRGSFNLGEPVDRNLFQPPPHVQADVVLAAPRPAPAPAPKALPESVDEVITVGTVTPSQPRVDVGTKGKGRRFNL